MKLPELIRRASRSRRWVRIEVRHTRDDGWVATSYRAGGSWGLRQACHVDRDGAVDVALGWCIECWRDGLAVDLAEYDECGALRFSVSGFRSASEVEAWADRVRTIRERVVRALEEAVP